MMYQEHGDNLPNNFEENIHGNLKSIILFRILNLKIISIDIEISKQNDI